MNEGIDERLLLLTARLADGGAIDWEQAREELPPDLVTRLASLDRLFRAMRSDPAAHSGLDLAQGDTEQWGHLRIGAPLAEGGYGVVVRAFDPILQREVALKLRRPDAMDEVTAWIHEARRLARVRHPNVLAVHGADIHNNVPGLWSDLVVGQTLAERVRDGPLDKSQLLSLAAKLSAAVAAVHAEGIVHGDIKPGNVMVEAGGRVVLMDFGTATESDAEPAAHSVVGSPLVMAPETLDGERATAASDLYALGAVFHFAASGRYPVEAATLEELRRKLPSGYREVAPEIRPRALRRLIARMLDPRPERRPEIGRVSNTIARIAEAPQRRRRVAALGSIVLLLAGGLTVASVGYYRVRAAQAETSAVNELLADTLNAPRGTAQGRNVRVAELLGQAVEAARNRFGDRPLALARVQALAGRTYVSLGRHEEARPLLEQALAILRARLGANHPRTVEVLDPMARAANAEGDPERAREIWQEMRARSDGNAPEIRNNAISARIGLADLERDANRLEAAERLLREAIAAGAGEPTWREVARARSILVQVLVAAGRPGEADPIGQAALEDSLRINGSRNVNTLIARDALVRVKYATGQFDAAERLARENLAVALDWLGEGDRHTVMMQSGLSNVLHDRGQLDESLELLQSAIAGAQQAFPAGSIEPLNLQVNLVARYLDLGRFDEAIAQAERTAALTAEDASPGGQLGMINGINLAEAFYRAGRANEALAQARAMQRTVGEILGDRHPFYSVAGGISGAAMTRLGQAADAESTLRSSHETLSAALGAGHPLTLDVAAFLAECLFAQGRVEDARTLANATRAALIEAVGPAHLKVRLIDELIARIGPAEHTSSE